MNASLNEKYTLVTTPAEGVAGQTDIESAIIDMAGFDGVKFYIPFGAITTGAATSVKVQQNSANSSSGMENLDIDGAASITIADDDDNKLVVVEVYQPQKRYLRVLVDRGTQNSAVGAIIAAQFGPKKAPVTNDGATIKTVKTLISPAAAA